MGKIYFGIIGLLWCCQVFSQSIDITREWRLNIGDSAEWRNPSYNDHHWKKVEEINRFEASGLGDFQDFGWARKKVTFPSSMKEAAQKAGYFYLSLGKIYDADQVFFNGKLVGQSGGMPPAEKLVERGKRLYKVPAEDILWDEENLIAVKVFSNFHNGGLQGERCYAIIPSENVFHKTNNTIAKFPLENNQQPYEMITSASASLKEEALNAGGLALKIDLPKDASIFYNGKLIGKTNAAGRQAFFVPSSFISWGNNDRITAYVNGENALQSILLAAPIFDTATQNHFDLMQVSDLKIRKGSLKGNSPFTASVKVFNSTNQDFDGKLTLSLVTDISNIQQTSSQTVHLNKLQIKEVDFILTPDFSGVYQLDYVLQNVNGEKITGTLAKGEK